MQLATLHLAPILAAEKSRVPFYIAGGVLVAWAMIVSVGIGMRRENFPGSLRGEHLVIGISAVLVLATAASAVLTSSTPAKASASASKPTTPTQSPAGGESAPAPAPTPPAAGTSTPAGAPKATTGTPAPPSSPAATAATALKLTADPAGALSYDAKALRAKAGTVTITLANTSPLEHNVTIASGSTVLGATPSFTGGAKSVTLKLKPGTYTFYCSVPGHRQAGMEGTLTVS
jgi:plastocyanin